MKAILIALLIAPATVLLAAPTAAASGCQGQGIVGQNPENGDPCLLCASPFPPTFCSEFRP